MGKHAAERPACNRTLERELQEPAASNAHAGGVG